MRRKRERTGVEIARITSGKPSTEDKPLDTSLRPRRFDDFIGQTKAKDNLKIAIEAAKGRGEALDHILLYGPPGLGKTTSAEYICSMIYRIPLGLIWASVVPGHP